MNFTHAITIRPALVVESAHRPWAAAITITAGGRHFTPSYAVVARGRWITIPRRDWPLTVRPEGRGRWQLTSRGRWPPAFRGVSYLRFLPSNGAAPAQTGVSVAPAVSLFVGHRGPVAGRLSAFWGFPVVLWGSDHLELSAHNAGHSWWLPQPRITVNAQSVPLRGLTTPLLPGQSVRMPVRVSLPLGWDAISIRSPDALPVSGHILSLPGIPLAVGLGLFGIAEAARWGIGKNKKKKKE